MCAISSDHLCDHLTLIKNRDDAAGAIGQLQGWGLCSSITFKLTTQVTQIYNYTSLICCYIG